VIRAIQNQSKKKRRNEENSKTSRESIVVRGIDQKTRRTIGKEKNPTAKKSGAVPTIGRERHQITMRCSIVVGQKANDDRHHAQKKLRCKTNTSDG
jgi:hypothetical protein